MIHPAFNILESVAMFSVVLATDVASSTLEGTLAPLIQSLGIPGAWLAVAAYTLRKIVLWGMPRVERLLEAHIARQAVMADCQRSLTDSTIAIQQENQKTLAEIKGSLPRLCLHPKTTP